MFGRAELMGDDELTRFLEGIRPSVDRTVAQLPLRQLLLEQYRKAPAVGAMQG
jgi:tryptophan 7-halogenase